MEWFERMNAVVDYLEANLDSDIDLVRAADIACCSTYHLQRVFLAVFGVSIAEYVRRRRLSMAASDILSGNERVIDVALKYGYDSPDSFSRAFRNQHNVTPSAARAPGVRLVAFPRLRFHIMLTGGTDMDYRIVDKPAFDLIVKSEKMTSTIYEDYVVDPDTWENFWWKFWEEFHSGNGGDSLRSITGGKPGAVTGADYLGVTIVGDDEKGFSFGVGVEKDGIELPENYTVVHVPASVWAVFTSTGKNPKALHDLQDRVFREWLPSIGYEHDSAPELEVYLPGDRERDDYRCEYWMPVVKK